jgi:hypothetical protein
MILKIYILLLFQTVNKLIFLFEMFFDVIQFDYQIDFLKKDVNDEFLSSNFIET